jgi:lysophospholipase L1-like esterase
MGHGLLSILVACAIAVGAQATEFAATKPTARVDYWQKRQAEITAQIAQGQDLSGYRLVFIGDSITDFWLLGDNPWATGQKFGRAVWDQSFGKTSALPALNLGISGDRIEHVLYRIAAPADGGIGQLDRADLKPEAVVLMLGINNSYDAETPADAAIFAGVKAAVVTIHARKPGARIILQSLLPTSDEAKNAAIVRPVNAQLKALAASPAYAPFVTWLDLYPGFVDTNGKQIAGLFNDGLHPNEAGYRVWHDRLLPVVKAVGRGS